MSQACAVSQAGEVSANARADRVLMEKEAVRVRQII